MTHSTRESIYEAIASIRLIDPHTHINPHSPASQTLADLLGYHYYTELAHSAGMPKDQIEEDGIAPRELVRRLVQNLGPLENTAQYRWLVEICRMLFGFDGDRIDESNWESVYDSAESAMASADWAQTVLDQSNVEAVFLTNDFDDGLEGFDSDTYIPCLRTDDLVFHLSKTSVRHRLEACSGVSLQGDLQSLRTALRQRFVHFVNRGARACAISLPPTFSPAPVPDGRATTALDEVLTRAELANDSHKQALARHVFWTLAELCEEFGLPFDLMIGVNRGVYADGVFQGQDLYDSRVSLLQYRELFNAFPQVKFPISVLASVTNQELVSHAWIFPNVITNGHWWYSNTPSFIRRDAAARLEAVPKTKQIAYYSDAYKLEFVWPKFDMYRHTLADILADHFVGSCGWSEDRAIELGRQVLRDNVDAIFPKPAPVDEESSQSDSTLVTDDGTLDPLDTIEDVADSSTSAALAAGAIGVIPVEAPETVIEDLDDAEEKNSETLPMEIETVLEEPKTTDTITMDADESPFESNEETLAEMGTLLDENETIRMIDEAEDAASTETQEVPDSLDPIPSEAEVESLEAADVTLDPSAEVFEAPSSETIELEADAEPLDVGKLEDDDDMMATIEAEPISEPELLAAAVEGGTEADDASSSTESPDTDSPENQVTLQIEETLQLDESDEDDGGSTDTQVDLDDLLADFGPEDSSNDPEDKPE